MNRIKLRDVEPVPGSRWCRVCERAKPVHLFKPGRNFCKECVRRRDNESHRGRPRHRDLAVERAKRAAYRATAAGKAAAQAYRSTLRGRLAHQLSQLNQRLKRAKSPQEAERLRGLIADVIEIRERLRD
jgi:hypothetical protein